MTEYSLRVLDAMQGFDGDVETRLYADVTRPNSMMIYSNRESLTVSRLHAIRRFKEQ